MYFTVIFQVYIYTYDVLGTEMSPTRQNGSPYAAVMWQKVITTLFSRGYVNLTSFFLKHICCCCCCLALILSSTIPLPTTTTTTIKCNNKWKTRREYEGYINYAIGFHCQMWCFLCRRQYVILRWNCSLIVEIAKTMSINRH